MATRTVHRAEHTLVVDAPASRLYELVADASRWPAVFAPSVYVRHIERAPGSERFEIWAHVGDTVAHWSSRRVLDAGRHYVSFRQDHSRPPLEWMGGSWLLRPLTDGRTEVVLRHRFAVRGDDPEAEQRVRAALDTNSPVELAALARIAELGHPVEDVVFSFTDTVPLPGGARAAYAFVDRADLWAERLPHVARSVLTEDEPGIQVLEMDTVTADGSSHRTRSVRVCDPAAGWIAYKQTELPKLLSGHSGLWTFGDGPDGPVAVSTHTVVIDPSAVTGVLGAGATLADARAYLRDALGRNSRTTMAHAAAFADGAVSAP